ncbi:UNVERIFIED_CONTAM: hypothetical protein Sangu_0888500 [Sesamum angustifolium]|uniref:Uncharacterized protein n=1 Tax=Sesamum angustifolium TaxID=2727405 RepID=A0AAW2P9U3_9LAMI
MAWQFLVGLEGERPNSKELKWQRLGWGGDGDGCLGSGHQDSTDGSAVEVCGDAACGQGRRDYKHLALVGAGCGQLLRHEEEVAVLVGFGLLHQAVLCVVALQFHHRP